MKLIKKYPPGTEPRYVPKPASIEETHRAGFLKEHVAVARLFLDDDKADRLEECIVETGEDGTVYLIESWRLGSWVGINMRQAEKAAVSMGALILYGQVKVSGKTGVRRCVRMRDRDAWEYLIKVRQYRDRKLAERKGSQAAVA